MSFVQSLFSGQNPALTLVWVVLALAVLLVASFWLFRKIAGSRALKPARNRAPRLAVTDAAIVDDKRRLVLVRRDNVEHLVMIGGPADIVIEQNIQRAQPAGNARETAPVPPRETLVAAAETPAQPKVAAIDFPARIKARNAATHSRTGAEADQEELPSPLPERQAAQPAAVGSASGAVTNIIAAARRGRTEAVAEKVAGSRNAAVSERPVAATAPAMAQPSPEVDFEVDLVSELEREAATAIASVPDAKPQPAARSFEDELAAEMGEGLDFAPSAQTPPVSVQSTPSSRSRAKPEEDVDDEMQRLLKELANA